MQEWRIVLEVDIMSHAGMSQKSLKSRVDRMAHSYQLLRNATCHKVALGFKLGLDFSRGLNFDRAAKMRLGRVKLSGLILKTNDAKKFLNICVSTHRNPTETTDSPSRCQFYKTFSVRNLRILVIS
jgi:hypothetical protein